MATEHATLNTSAPRYAHVEEAHVYQLLVQWNTQRGTGGMVELTKSGIPMLLEHLDNDDCVYGWCRAIVAMLRLQGDVVEMPLCLRDYLDRPNRMQED